MIGKGVERVKNRNRMVIAKPVPAALLEGWLAEMAILAAGCFALAICLEMRPGDWNTVGYGVMAALLAASYVGAKIAAGKVQNMVGAMCIASGLLLLTTLTAISLVCFGGELADCTVPLMLIIGGTGTAALTGKKRERVKANRRRKRRKVGI